MNKWLVRCIFVGMFELVVSLADLAQQSYGKGFMFFVLALVIFTFAHFELRNIFRRDEEKR